MFEDVEEIRKDGETPIKFYYNREERIKKASSKVQEYYEGGMRPVKGIKSLFYKGNKYIFFALIFFVATVWIYTGINKNKAYLRIDNIYFDAQCYLFKNEVLANVRIYSKEKELKSKPKKINVVFNFFTADNLVFKSTKLSADYVSGEQYLRTKVTDYDIIKIGIEIDIEGKEKQFTTIVPKK